MNYIGYILLCELMNLYTEWKLWTVEDMFRKKNLSKKCELIRFLYALHCENPGFTRAYGLN